MAKPPIDGNAVIPDDWEGQYCSVSICWPNSPKWHAVLRGQLTEPAYGRFWRASTGIITDAQEVIKATFDNNLHFTEVIMDCNGASVLASAMNNIATALGNSSQSGCCGSGSAGGGSFPANSGGVNTGGSDPAVDDAPNGYPNWDVFFEQKCGVAHEIIDDLKLSLAHLMPLLIAGISFETIVEVLIVALTLTISSAGIAAIAALILTIGSVVIAATALSIVNDNEDALVCALVQGTNSSSSRNSFLAKFGEVVDAAAVDVIEGFAMKQLIAYMVELGETNRMYTYNATMDYSSSDCPCPVECCFEWTNVGDTLGWYPDATDPSGVNAPPVSGNISQTDEDGGALKFGLELSAGSYYAAAISPVMDCLIETGMVLCQVNSSSSSGSENAYLSIVTNMGAYNLVAITGEATGASSVSLEPYVGERLQQIWVAFSRGDADTFVNVSKIGICNTCE